METNGTPCLVKNSFIRRQLVQPGCQYALMTVLSADDCAMRFSSQVGAGYRADRRGAMT
jgi:hypothetical protein